ncbi:MAG: quinolinate synthase NadA [Cyanobacteria bacterium J06648_11]
MFANALLSESPSRAAELPVDPFEAIARLKRELNAIVLAHYYQEPDIQDVADYVGDSLGLSRQAASTDANVIVFAGVHFMAETAKILNPDKLVLLPDLNAGCSLADACPPDEFAKFKAAHPDSIVVSYVNCSAAIKAMSDVICTSSNAVNIVRQLPEDKTILFAPDRNLGRYVMEQTGRDMVLWQGSCIVHETFSEKKIIQLVQRHPGAELIAHPECEPPILERADFIGSTTALLNYARDCKARELIVATEPGILHQMQKSCPDKVLIPAPPQANCACNECPHMRLNTLEKLVECMEKRSPEIALPEAIRQQALKPIQRMLEMS